MIKQAINKILEKIGMKTFEISKGEIKDILKKENPLILEVGCNDGTDTLDFLETFKDCKIYCFEPDPRAIKQFKVQDKRCKLFKIAISNEDGETTFNLSGGKDPYGKMDDWDQSSSIKKPKKHLKDYPWCNFDKKIKVKTKKLDTWAKENNINEVDFMWVDVQGAERELIEGGINTLNNTKYLYTEFYDEEMYEGQLNLQQILGLLPTFEIVKRFGNNVLLKNGRKKDKKL